MKARRISKSLSTSYIVIFVMCIFISVLLITQKVRAADMGPLINVASPTATDGVSVPSGMISFSGGGTYTLTGTTTTRRITCSGEVTLYLKGVSVTSSAGPPLQLNNGASVTLVLVDGTVNKFVCTKTTAGSNAAINVDTGRTLIIAADVLGTGSLTATASAGQGGGGGAGIGGNGSSGTGSTAGSCGLVIINGGNVTAEGGNYSVGSDCGGGGAGIGGGGTTGTAAYKGGSPGTGGTITVNGGKISAVGGSGYGGGAGVGGGGAAYSNGGNNGTVNINGGTVIANGGRSFTSGGSGGAGIGGGGRNGSSYTSGSGGTVTINGGNVTATGSTATATTGGGAGIGGGGGSGATNTTGAGSGSTLVIKDIAEVKAYSYNSLPALHTTNNSLSDEDSAHVINASLDSSIATISDIIAKTPTADLICLKLPSTYKNFAFSTRDEGIHSITASANYENRQVVLVSNGSKDIQASRTISPSQNVTLGQTVIPTLDVNFDPQGGSLPFPASKEVTIGQEYGVLPVTEKRGFRFIGWFLDE